MSPLQLPADNEDMFADADNDWMDVRRVVRLKSGLPFFRAGLCGAYDAFGDGCGLITRAIVDDDDLVSTMIDRLMQQRAQAVGQCGGCVVGRHND